MSRTYATAAIIGNTETRKYNFLVDTGATHIGLLENELEELGLSKSAFVQGTLSECIDVAHKIGLLKVDVHKFIHGLREFRNYIHPYQQLRSGFTPDEHTAKICFQVLKASLASVAGER